MNGDDGVQPIALPRQQRRKLQTVDLGGQLAKLALNFRGDVFALAPQLEISVEVSQFSREEFVRLDLFFQAFALGENLLGSFRILPEIRLGYLVFKGFDLAAAGRGVKENSAVRGCASSVGQIRVAVLQSWELQNSEVRRQKSEARRRTSYF
jgi:ribosomal protein L19